MNTYAQFCGCGAAIQSIEVVRAESQLIHLAEEMESMSTVDDVIKVEGNTITLTYVGRGTEVISFVLMKNIQTAHVFDMHVKTWRDLRRLSLILFRGLLRRRL